MNKFIILAALIYFVSSSSECSQTYNPKDRYECLNAGTGEADATCCYLYYSNIVSVCLEIPNSVTDYYEYLKQYYPAYKDYTVDCKGEFNFGILKTLILVVSLVLL